jgi:hypothetical protein
MKEKDSKNINKIALVYCVHHKPWLIMSTIITTLIQDFQDFDIYFIYNEGNGTDVNYEKYREYYNEYYRIKESQGANKQLDKYDENIKKVCQLNRNNIYEISYTNDHGLDSGAWYKFIQSGKWEKYEYTLFMGEGALFTHTGVLRDTMEFVRKNNVHFITGSQEKRFVSKDKWLGGFASSKTKNEMTTFHDKMIDETYAIFQRDKDFCKILKLWPEDIDGTQENHIPNVWGPDFLLLKYISNNPLRYSLLNKVFNPKRSLEYKIPVDCRVSLFNSDTDLHKQGKTYFHTSSKIGWYGATCNHFMSRKFLNDFSKKLDEFDIYDVIELPFSATALEQIWGLIPSWVGYKIWFFDGLHRVRKNFFTYKREDFPNYMTKYINRYFYKDISVSYDNNLIKIKNIYDKHFNKKEQFNIEYFD